VGERFNRHTIKKRKVERAARIRGKGCKGKTYVVKTELEWRTTKNVEKFRQIEGKLGGTSKKERRVCTTRTIA